MNLEQAKDYIRKMVPQYLKQDNSKKGYVCPICGSGSGHKGTGLTTKDGIHYTCWAGCFTSFDLIDIIGVEYRLTDYTDKLRKACEIFNITIENGRTRTTAKEEFTPIKHAAPVKSNETATEKEDYTQFFEEAARHIEETDYHRGLSLITLKRFKVGFVKEWRHPKIEELAKTDEKYKNVPPSPRLIIPTSPSSYIARDTRKDLTDKEKEYAKSKAGNTKIFNQTAIWEAVKPIFVVEGEIDALSVIDAGGEAVALGGIGNAKALVAMLETKPPKEPLLLALDKDERGQKAERELAEALEKLHIPFYRVDITGDCKDANEALNTDKQRFRLLVHEAENIEAQMLEAEKEKLRREAASFTLKDFWDKVEKSKTASFIPTGFGGLDSLLDGGLYPGLYFVGAVSSLGKTTFCLQIADQIAQGGNDVIIFSLEMAREELIAKSLSRLTLIEDLRTNHTKDHAKTTRGILTGTRYAGYSLEEKKLIAKATDTYNRYAQNIYIVEGVGDVGVADIRDRVQKHIRITGKTPVVVIDYLQIIAPYDVHCTDKQNTDKAVMLLKQLSRDAEVPIIGISSFNRENYNAPVSMASFKESGKRNLCHAV